MEKDVINILIVDDEKYEGILNGKSSSLGIGGVSHYGQCPVCSRMRWH